MKQNNKYFMWLVVAALLSGSSYTSVAERIDASTARSLATKFVNANASRYKKAPARIEATPVYTPGTEEDIALYVFNNPDDSGFTIVSGDDNLPAILGYSTDGKFDYASIPPNMKSMIDGYVSQINHYYRTGKGERIIISQPEHKPIDKLLTTTWNQDSPFNDQCPVISGQHAPSGCSATATSQVMNFHKWPPKGIGTTVQGLNIDGTEYKWDLMADHYFGRENTESRTAVATLLYHVGSAVNMQYALEGSGAIDPMLQYALLYHFDYNPGITYILHDFMSDIEWDNAIYTELSEGRPVIMSGHAPAGGHCFVVDGYDGKGYYHLNWGWGGSQDGFFLLNLLNPASGGIGSFDGGYNSNQGALLKVYPAGVNDTQPQILLLADSEYIIRDSDRTLRCANDGLIYNPTGRTITCTLNFRLESLDESDSNIYTERLASVNRLASLRAYDKLSLPTLHNVPDGDYKATIWISAAGYEDIQVCTPYGVPDYLYMTIQNGRITSYKGETSKGEVGITAIDGLNFIHAGQPLQLTAKVSNVSDMAFAGDVNLNLYDADRKLVMTAHESVSLNPGVSATINFYTDNLPASGEYFIGFSTPDGEIGSLLPITIEPSLDHRYGENGIIAVDVKNTRFAEGAEFIEPVVTLANNYSESKGFSPTANLYDSEFNVLTSASVGLYLAPNKSEDVTVFIYYPGLTSGTYYIDLKSSTYGNMSPYIPIHIYRPGQNEEVAYEIISENDHIARIVAPTIGYYSGTVNIPETVEKDYTVNDIDASALMGSIEVTAVSLPHTIDRIPSGTFRGTSINRLTVNSEEPPVLCKDAFDNKAAQSTLLIIPDGSANKYAQAEGWDAFHIPAWTITVEEGIQITGLQTDASSGTFYTPYYVGGEESLQIGFNGVSTAYAVINVDGGNTTVVSSVKDKLTLPVLGTADGVCKIVKDISGVVPVLADGSRSDIYNLQGVCVLRNASLADLNNLGAGIYIIGGVKFIVK